MLGPKQEQTTESGATALQAGRDINIHGLSVSEVRELCILFLRDNFPKLREEAKQIAEEQVRVFATNLEVRLANDAASIALEKFREPDVQAAINDAVQASARRGAAANPNVLSTLISERVAKHTNDYKDMVLSEAVHVVPRLTGQQIALLSFVHSVRSMIYQGLPNISGLEQVGRVALTFSSSSFGLSDSQKQHLQYAGAASVNNILGGDIFDIQRQEYKYLGFDDPAAFKAAVAAEAPSYMRLLEQYTADNLFAINLTSVGQAIALANISNFIGKLDYTIWLK
jgi:hypothetical protein